MHRQSCQRRPGRTTIWFCPEPGWRPTVAPHEIDHVLPGPSFSVRGHDGYTVVTIGGEIDIASAPVLREQLLGPLQPYASQIVIDLSGVTFCDTRSVSFTGPPPRVRLPRRPCSLGAVS